LPVEWSSITLLKNYLLGLRVGHSCAGILISCVKFKQKIFIWTIRLPYILPWMSRNFGLNSPSVWHFLIFDDWILGLNCFEILNEFKRKYLLKHYKVFLSKALKTVFQKAKKVGVTFCRTTPRPLRVSRIIWMTPKATTLLLSTRDSKRGWSALAISSTF
jgi:hypothetical protein